MKYGSWFNGEELPEELTRNDMIILFNRMKQGDMKAREEIINHNIKFVIYCVRNKFRSVDYDNEELVSVGCLGLVKAVDTYDISKGREFSTYAGRCIINEINYFLRSLKKNSKVLCFEDVAYLSSDGNDLKLEDVIPSKIDIERDYMESEYSKLELDLLKQSMECLDERNKKIVMLYFGFFDGKVYAQKEISDMLNISQPQVSRKINRSLKKIKTYMQQLELGVDVGKIKDNSKIRKEGRKMRRLKTIYELLNDYTREEIDEVIESLTDYERELLRLRYGDDLDNPVSTISIKDRKIFYSHLIPRMKRLLAQARDNKAKIDDKELVKDRQDKVPEQSIDKSDYVNMLEMLKTPTFSQMLSILSVKEAIIVSLRFGYVDGKYFDTKTIASFLDISEDEVRDTTMKALLLYKENINNFIDKAINIVSNNTLKKKN